MRLGRALAPLAALAALAALLAYRNGEEPAAASFVLITLDTTRRDAMGFHGAPAGLTPALDALAAESTVFTEARTVAPLTLPAHASMLTGLYPPRHTVRDNSLTSVPHAAVTLAERARAEGIETGAVVAAAVLSRHYGLDQGFDHYDEPAREGHGFSERAAEEVTERAVAWLDARPSGGRFFLWAHYFDPHRPLKPGPDFLERAGGVPYLGAVARMDAGVGALLDALRARPDWERTLVIVVADHGEANGDHGEETHSAFVYDSTLRVPLVVRFPKGERAGERVGAPVSVADVFPTAVDLLGLGGAGDVDGMSLARAIDPERGVYFESCYGAIYHQWSPLAGWVDAHGKYVHSSAPQFFVPSEDPGETANRIAERDVAPYRAALERVAAAAALPAASAEEGSLDRALLSELEALGYAGAGGVADLPSLLDAPSDRPSPHDCAEELRLIVLSWNLAMRDRLAEAAAALEAVVARNPNNHQAWARLGRLRLRLGNPEAGAAALERFVAIGPPWPEPFLNLGLCYGALGRYEEALRWIEAGLGLDPKNPEGLEAAALYARSLGRADEAAAYHALAEEARAAHEPRSDPP